jgi:hypothetical protein
MNYRASSWAVQFPSKFIGKIGIEVYLPGERSTGIAPGIAVNTHELTASGHVQGINITQATELRLRQDPTLFFHFD